MSAIRLRNWDELIAPLASKSVNVKNQAGFNGFSKAAFASLTGVLGFIRPSFLPRFIPRCRYHVSNCGHHELGLGDHDLVAR
jgi:hypothetical protein